MTLDELKAKISKDMGGTEVGPLCLLLVDELWNLPADETRHLTYESFQNLLKIEQSTKLLAAINYLTQAEESVLDARGIFLYGDELEYELSPIEFSNVVKSNFLIHPISGEVVENPRKYVFPFFSFEASEA